MPIRFGLRRALSAALLTTCVLLLGQVPVAHVASNLRPGAADLPIPVEDQQRSDAGERVWQAQVALRHRKQVTYQETVEAPVTRGYPPPMRLAAPLAIPPTVYSGAPLPLRC